LRDPSDETESIATRVVLAVRQRCLDIARERDYRTDLGCRVLMGRPTLDAADLPALLVFSGQEDAEQKRGKTTYLENILVVFIEGRSLWNGVYEDQPELVAQDMVADIKRAVLRDKDQTFMAESGTNLVKSIHYAGRVIGYPRDGSRAVSARVRIDVEYREQYGAPSEPV